MMGEIGAVSARVGTLGGRRQALETGAEAAVAKDPLGREILTAETLARMTPEENAAHREASMIFDVGSLPADLLAHVRRVGQQAVDELLAEDAAGRRGIPHAS